MKQLHDGIGETLVSFRDCDNRSAWLEVNTKVLKLAFRVAPSCRNGGWSRQWFANET